MSEEITSPPVVDGDEPSVALEEDETTTEIDSDKKDDVPREDVRPEEESKEEEQEVSDQNLTTDNGEGKPEEVDQSVQATEVAGQTESGGETNAETEADDSSAVPAIDETPLAEEDGSQEPVAPETEDADTPVVAETETDPVSSPEQPAPETSTLEPLDPETPGPEFPAPPARESSTVEETGVVVDSETNTAPTDLTDDQTDLGKETRSDDVDTVFMSSTASVKCVLVPSGQVSTQAFALSTSLHSVKCSLAVQMKIPEDVISIMHDGGVVEGSKTIADLGVGPNAVVQLEIMSSKPDQYPLKTVKPAVDYTMPDVITVTVKYDDGVTKDIVVEIERIQHQKPFLGGFRHKLSGVEFHNASAQTNPKTRPWNGVEKNCRDTQTVDELMQRQQTMIDTATQMTMIGVYVSNMTDKLITPKMYETAEDFLLNRLNAVIKIQSYTRMWAAKSLVEGMKRDKGRRLDWEHLEEIRKKKEKENRIKAEFERRMNPKSKEDFDLLYHALENWRQEELDIINETKTGPERKAALCWLLDQETQLIAAIGRHKIQAGTESKEKSIRQFLNKASSPKKWRTFDGKVTKMYTPYTQRANELKDIYNSLTMNYLTQDERLDVLLTVKHTVLEHDCKLTQEIVELIDREADLLMRSVKDANLEGLRKRIATLFLQYCKTPTFNPEAARLVKVPQDPLVLRKNIYYCSSCNSYLPSTEFSLSSNSGVAGKCRRCNKLDNDARQRQDYSNYVFMLRNLRQTEEKFGDQSKICFLLQEEDLQYLVENVWGGQSAVSAWDDLYDLVLIRWNQFTEWSPWNCILLTKDEAASHQRMENLDEAYGSVFINKVKQKHTLARNFFSRLKGMAERMRDVTPNKGARSANPATTIMSSKA